jgi:HAD superfamily hydrolase (TIGR01509 family)
MESLPPQYSAVLWDIDGTLVDTTALIVDVLTETFMEFAGRTLPPEEWRKWIGIPLQQQMFAFGDPASFGTTWEEMSAAAIRKYERGRAQERVIPEAIEALREGKRRGNATGLVTSKNRKELAYSLPRLGISAYCNVIVCADDVTPRVKPDPYPVQLALQRLGVRNPAGAIFIGDSVHDIKSGNAAGVATAAVLWGAAPEAALVAEGPGRVFRRPDELIPGLFGRSLATAA